MTVVLELFAGNVVRMLQVPAESVDKTILYLRVCSAGILVIIAYNVISGVLRGVGNANLPFLFVGIACVVNIIGDLFFVGLCKCIQETMVQISFLVVNSIVNQMGLMPSAGYGIAQKIISFIMLVPSSVMQSVSAFVAQNIGAGQKERAWKGFLTAMAAGCAAGVLIFLAGFFGGGVMSSVFTDDGEVIAQSADYLRGFSVECILTCVLFSSIGYFNGRGRSIPVMIQGISSAFCIRIPVSIFMSRLPNASLMLVGLATPITTVYGILFFMICFARLRRE